MQTNSSSNLNDRAETSLVAADVRPRTLNSDTVGADSLRRLHDSAAPCRWLMALAALAMLLCANAVQAQVSYYFDDGGTHTINDATYQDGWVFVRNNTTLIIEPGAVLGGALDFGGKVVVSDTSIVTINGGSFGGSGYQSGSIFPGDTSTVTINAGSFGGSGDESGNVWADGSSTVTIYGGSFGGTGAAAGNLIALNTSVMLINGGTFGASPSVYGAPSAAMTIRAASFEDILVDPATGATTLKVTFCSQGPQSMTLYGVVTLQTVVCVTPTDRINELIVEVNSLSIKAAIKNALVAKLNAALNALSLDDTATACAGLQDFINLCLAQTGKKLVPAAVADDLIADANEIRELIGCP